MPSTDTPTYTLAQVAKHAQRRGDRFDRQAAARCIAWESLRERRQVPSST